MIRDIAGLMILYDILYIVCFVRQLRFLRRLCYFRASAPFYFDGCNVLRCSFDALSSCFLES